MHIRYFSFIYLILMAPSFAGNRLKDECDLNYYHHVYVQGVNVISNWQSSGPAVNIKINDTWYAKKFSDSANDGFYQLAYLAYMSQARVNVCVGSGLFRGIEFM